MSAQSTIAKLRAQVTTIMTEARARGEQDADIIESLAKALTPEQLQALYRDAVREDRTNLSAAIEKQLFPTRDPSYMGDNGELSSGAGVFEWDASADPIIGTKKANTGHDLGDAIVRAFNGGKS